MSQAYDAKNRWPSINAPMAQSNRPPPVPPREMTKAPNAINALPAQTS
jgi:hypothetical protein